MRLVCLRVCVVAYSFITALCAPLCKCVNLWYFQMNVCECAYVCVRKCLSEHRGGGGGAPLGPGSMAL